MDSHFQGRKVRLKKPIHMAGETRQDEQPTVLMRLMNLDREMFLVEFEDGATTFLFQDEFEVI